MNVPSYEQLLADNERLRAELENAKSVPMKYRRMEFNAQLQNENTRLRAELDALKASFMCVHESHETLYQELRANPVPASVPEGWLRAIDEALVVTHLGVANAEDSYEDAKRKLDALIGWHCDVVTDPAVNGGWKLVPVEILDRFPEINQNNYNHDDVCNLNAWGVELVLAAAPKPEETK